MKYLLVSMVLSVALVACGGGGGSSGGMTASQSELPEVVAPESAEEQRPEPEQEPSTEPPRVIYPVPEINYKPEFPAIGQYSVAGICESVHDDADFRVTLRDGERLINAYNRLKDFSAGKGGVLEIPWDVETVQCDNLWINRGRIMDGPLTIKGLPGPNGEQPRFYCRSDTRDGTVPRAEVEGVFLYFGGSYSQQQSIVVENLHSDGYKKAMTLPSSGHVVVRNNYFHHGLSDGLGNSNNTSGSGGVRVEMCGNEIAHFGQGNTIHNLYLHRSVGGAGNNEELDGSGAWNSLWFVDNVCHSSPSSHCLKSISNENNIINNRFYGTLETDPGYSTRYGSTLIDIAACSKNTITGNLLHAFKPVNKKYGTQIIGIRNRKTIVRGCDLPVMWGPEKIPVKVAGPAHSSPYWQALGGEILFPTIIEDNTFIADGEYGASYFAITMYGTYPNYETGLGSPSCWLPTPDAWYERARVYSNNNTYRGLASDHLYRNYMISHSFKNNCPTELPPPGPGPAEDMIEAGSNEVLL